MQVQVSMVSAHISTGRKVRVHQRFCVMGTNAATPRRSPRLSSPANPSSARSSPAAKRLLGLSPASSSRPGAKPSARKVGVNKKGKKRKTSSSRVYVSRLVYDGSEFEVGDDVYVRKVEYSGSHESDEEVEECRICGEVGGGVLIECNDCLGGFHLGCLNPPLEAVPEGDWMCGMCEMPEKNEQPIKRHRTARERLFAKELWAARIERLWKEPDGSAWFSGLWYVIPEETAMGRQPHNGRRELFRTNHVDENEMESILRHCYVMSREDFDKATSEGDDVFFCEYEYDVKWYTFKRIVDMDDPEPAADDENCESEVSDGAPTSEHDDVSSGTCRRRKSLTPNRTPKRKRDQFHAQIKALRERELPKDAFNRRPSTDIEKAKIALALSAVPGSLPCREKESKEIEAFVADAIGKGMDCLGKCLYISGVPGTGKTATVLEVMRGLDKKVNAGELQPYRFVEINGLRLTSPEQTYTVIHEALTGQRLGWKRALQLLDERFSQSKDLKSVDARPCILLVDELDLLVTRTQSVLYNLFDWPCRSNSRLMVIGIANTIDLPERLLPRIASRMGLQRISFGPYSHEQLQEIISSRLSGIQAFERQAVEFASRKVAAVSGDARRALELCRRAAEIAESRQTTENSEPPQAGEESNGKLIGMVDIEAAITEMFQAPHVQVMKRCSKHAKIFLVAMVYEQNKSGMAETTFEKVARAHFLLCSNNGEQSPNKDTLLSIGCRLGECRLLLCESGSKHRLQKLQLNFPSDDVSFALRDSPELPWIMKYLP